MYYDVYIITIVIQGVGMQDKKLVGQPFYFEPKIKDNKDDVELYMYTHTKPHDSTSPKAYLKQDEAKGQNLMVAVVRDRPPQDESDYTFHIYNP